MDFGHRHRVVATQDEIVDIFNDQPPLKYLPEDDTHDLETTIVPRQIEDALKRIGTSNSIYGCPWAVTSGKSEAEERGEAEAQYRELVGDSDHSSDETIDTNRHASDESDTSEAFSCCDDETCLDSSPDDVVHYYKPRKSRKRSR